MWNGRTKDKNGIAEEGELIIGQAKIGLIVSGIRVTGDGCGCRREIIGAELLFYS